MATSEDIDMATREDFFMATDMLIAVYPHQAHNTLAVIDPTTKTESSNRLYQGGLSWCVKSLRSIGWV